MSSAPRSVAAWLGARAQPAALAALVEGVAAAGREISAHLRRARLNDALGALASRNVQGEQQQKLDVLADALLLKHLRACGACALYVSEEQAQVTALAARGSYALLADPLDGSSNIAVAAPVGTIFGVLPLAAGAGTRAENLGALSSPSSSAAVTADADERARAKNSHASAKNSRALEASVLRPGDEQCAAGYLLYGSSTLMVLAVARGVALFVLDPARDEFVLAEDALTLPARKKFYSVNEAYAGEFDAGLARFLNYAHGAGYSARYIGSMVADVHRTLLTGGVFLYPATRRAPTGKLRLLYEANPMAYITERAGGRATDGTTRILELRPEALHARTPIVLGDAHEVQRVMEMCACDTKT